MPACEFPSPPLLPPLVVLVWFETDVVVCLKPRFMAAAKVLGEESMKDGQGGGGKR